jgi:hypothetical protein
MPERNLPQINKPLGHREGVGSNGIPAANAGGLWGSTKRCGINIIIR